jgi:uncharacterized protein YbjT (DUF2867 family)
MKVVVIGASGSIGSSLVGELDALGHETVAAWVGSTLTGASVVVDVSGLDDTATRNLLAAEAAAGVGHHVALSVVGTEALIETSSIPYSLVRAPGMAAEDVARALAAICVGPPINGSVDLSREASRAGSRSEPSPRDTAGPPS